MNIPTIFQSKDDDSVEISLSKSEIQEIIPDADFRFSLLILKSGDKHFVIGTESEIKEKLGIR
ncbi:hypothetical protein [Dyadobacter diqingensis]|uniref:hypothetical protein n=1 Tax=Dyadobacter diqingensis TaxID=2938121 RepID=UPI0020C1E7B8|nr:hypothetical protein [Dyadobacter diqingensis]